MKIHFLRHATFSVTYNDVSLLVDPMFSPAKAWEPIADTPYPRRNPLVDLPLDDVALDTLIGGLSAVLVTHTHFDHWDDVARERLAKDLPLFCQPPNLTELLEAGFASAQAINVEQDWNGLCFHRTAGRHGTGAMGQKMGPVSGFMVQAPGQPTLYIAGDTIWCSQVADVLERFQPDVIVANAGAARFLTGDPITMSSEDIIQVCRASAAARVVAVHMEAINHCTLKRSQLAELLAQEGLRDRVQIPADGESIDF